VTLGVYSEVFDTEIATALGRINEALGGKPEDHRGKAKPTEDSPGGSQCGDMSADGG
jgi:hypothetical protein